MSQKVCSACGALNDVISAFCGRCGAPLKADSQGAPAYHPPTSPGTESGPPPTYGPSGTSGGTPDYGYSPGAGGSPNWGGVSTGFGSQAIPAGYLPAGFWIRLGAYLIDLLILSVVEAVLLAGGQVGFLSLLGALYFIIFWVVKGQTPGKMALGLYVVSSDGQPLGWGKAIFRYLGYIVSAIILGIGFFMIGFDDMKRGLHDRIASTLVVRKVT